MLSASFWLTLSVAFASVAAQEAGKKFTKDGAANAYIPNRFIVEFEDAAGLRKRQDAGNVSYDSFLTGVYLEGADVWKGRRSVLWRSGRYGD